MERLMRTGELGRFRRRRRCGGFTYLWAMMAVALLGLVLAQIGPSFAQSAQREREAQLMRIGLAYAQAIERYYHAHLSKQYPERLDQLLLDARFATTVRHIRDLYGDPVNRGEGFAPVRGGDGRVIGVRSQSEISPLRTQPWTDGRHSLPASQKYSDWQFLAKVDG